MPNPELARKAEVQRLASLPTTVPQGTPANTIDPAANLNPPAGPLPGTAPVVNNNQELVVIYGGEGTAYTSGSGKAIAIGPGASTTSTTQQSGSGETSANAQIAPPVQPLKQAAAELGQKNGSTPSVTPAPAAASQAKEKPKAKDLPTDKKTVKDSKGSTATAAPLAPTGKQVRVREYWIQVISSPNRDRVEQVKKELAAKGWSGRISMVPVNKVEYFRLRYGPFDQTDEAGKFLGYLKVVPGLEKAFLVEEYPVKTVAP